LPELLRRIKNHPPQSRATISDPFPFFGTIALTHQLKVIERFGLLGSGRPDKRRSTFL